MPRMSRKRWEEWDFFLNRRDRITCNDLCRNCRHGCKQSFRAQIVACREVPEQEERNMAVTRITAMHLNKGRTIAQCLKDRTDYAKNPGKSERCLFIFTKFIEPVVVIQESRNVVV